MGREGHVRRRTVNPRARSPKQKTPSGSPDPSWGIAIGTLAVTTRAPVCSGLGAPGEAEVACPASLPRAFCGLHLPPPSSWCWGVGRGYSLCSQSSEAPSWSCPGRVGGAGVGGCVLGQASGLGTRLRSPRRVVGHCSRRSCLMEGGIANAKPPREFPFWKVGSSPFMTFSRGRGEGALAGLRQRHYLCNDVSSHKAPQQCQQLGRAWKAGC